MMHPDTAKNILRLCGVPLGADFHTLRIDTVESLLLHADECRYRKPKNASGSRGRYFHAFLQRRANRES